jgi:hypothetical protein
MQAISENLCKKQPPSFRYYFAYENKEFICFEAAASAQKKLAQETSSGNLCALQKRLPIDGSQTQRWKNARSVCILYTTAWKCVRIIKRSVQKFPPRIFCIPCAQKTFPILRFWNIFFCFVPASRFPVDWDPTGHVFVPYLNQSATRFRSQTRTSRLEKGEKYYIAATKIDAGAGGA